MSCRRILGTSRRRTLLRETILAERLSCLKLIGFLFGTLIVMLSTSEFQIVCELRRRHERASVPDCGTVSAFSLFSVFHLCCTYALSLVCIKMHDDDDEMS